jgi:hypothetical protein
MQRTSQYHVFSLPSNLLSNLTPQGHVGQTTPQAPSPAPALPSLASNARACNICLAAGFGDVDEQRAHFRSDWHRYNVKMRLNGGTPVTESAFNGLIDGTCPLLVLAFLWLIRITGCVELEDSISGSASSSDEDDSADSDAITALVKKTKIGVRAPSPTDVTRAAPRTPLAWFHSPPATQIGVYKLLFQGHADPSSYLSELQDMQRPIERKWALFMTAGGHFAGAIVRVSNAEDDVDDGAKKKKPKKPKPDIEVLNHKTFHRYTSTYNAGWFLLSSLTIVVARRKQGGSQSVNDNAKGNAKSAGAQLRRYGEQSLRDVRTLAHFKQFYC